MTRDEANKILTLWKSGAQHFPQAIINHALAVTGDIAATLDRAHPSNEIT